MFSLIKGMIFFAFVLVALSYFSDKPAAVTEGTNAIQVGDAISAATGAYAYISAICGERPEVCEKGSETLSALGVRATEGARVAFQLLDKQFGDDASVAKVAADVALKQDPDPTPFPTGTIAPAQAAVHSDPISTGTVPLPLKRPHP
jgi:hypothetical protein